MPPRRPPSPTPPSAACGLRDLNDLVAAPGEVVLNDAEAINRSGQIAVNGTRGKAQRSYLLTPIRDAAGPAAPCGQVMALSDQPAVTVDGRKQST